GRIYTNGEETATVGSAWAHLLNGDTYQLPALGHLAFENVVPHPDAGDATIVMSMDDGPGGQVYVYKGMKELYGANTPVDAAGLNKGVLYGIEVIGLPVESNAIALPLNTPTRFEAVSLGDVRALAGATLDTNSVTAGATT